MQTRDFAELVAPVQIPRGTLLGTLEHIVVHNHAALHRDLLGEPWSPAGVYHWLRYEGPDPVTRLLEASIRLEQEWDKQGSPVDILERVADHERRHLWEAASAGRLLGYLPEENRA